MFNNIKDNYYINLDQTSYKTINFKKDLTNSYSSFGSIEGDSIHIDIAENENEIVSAFDVYITGSYSNVNQDYLDYSGRLVKYSYTRFTPNVMVENNSLAIFPHTFDDYLNSIGDYQIYVTLTRNLVGSPENKKLKISEISPSRKEFKFICESPDKDFYQFSLLNIGLCQLLYLLSLMTRTFILTLLSSTIKSNF